MSDQKPTISDLSDEDVVQVADLTEAYLASCMGYTSGEIDRDQVLRADLTPEQRSVLLDSMEKVDDLHCLMKRAKKR